MTAAAGLRAHLVVRRPGFTLDARLSVAPGEVVALVGPNGAGKSTVLRAVAGLARLDEGHVTLDGRVLDGPRTATPPERRGCGVVFQDHRVLGHLTALENVAFGLRARGARARAARAAAQGWLAAVGLADLAGRRASGLSGGQAQRVAIARALATDPALLLLDEPFAALDAGTRALLHDVLLTRAGRAPRPTLLVTHDERDAAALATRVVELADGRVVRDEPLAHAPGSASRAVPVSRSVPSAPVEPAARAVPSAPAQPAARTTSGDDPPPDGGRVAVVVLAGGTARRIGGGDKTALTVGGRPILHRLLAATAPWPTVVVADAPDPRVAAGFPHARWVREDPAGGGPAAALAAGVAAAEAGVAAAAWAGPAEAATGAEAAPGSDGGLGVVVALAGDHPFAGDALPRLLAALAGAPDLDAAVGVDDDGREQPLLAAYRADAVRARLRAVRPGDPVRPLLAGLAVGRVPLTRAEALDVDTPDDLVRARGLVPPPA